MMEQRRLQHMSLAVKPDLSGGTIHYRCILSISCGGLLRLAINRGLRVVSAYEDDLPIAYTQGLQNVWAHGDVDVLLFSCRPKGLVLTLDLEGTILPYQHFWRYVRDTINPRCTLFRTDAFAHPIRVADSPDGLAVQHDEFSYDIEVTLPGDYTALCGGLVAAEQTENDRMIFTFAEPHPIWRVDLVMGAYAPPFSSSGGTRFFLLEDSPSLAHGERIKKEADACINLFVSLLGVMPGARPLTAIEIPDGMGGQAGEGYFLQQGCFFADPCAVDGIYHEIAHGWTTARAAGMAEGMRFFDEAIASYLQVFALRRLHGGTAAAERLDGMRRAVGWALREAGSVEKTTLAHHGCDFQLAYNKGTFMLNALAEEMGEEVFLRALRDFQHKHNAASVDFVDFQQATQACCDKDLNGFFDFWLYSGESTLAILRA